jgi:hypothetical protein
MADFCQQCSIYFAGEDFRDLANLGDPAELGPDEGWSALCEGCGGTVVDQEGRCMAEWCQHDESGKPLSWGTQAHADALAQEFFKE